VGLERRARAAEEASTVKEEEWGGGGGDGGEGGVGADDDDEEEKEEEKAAADSKGLAARARTTRDTRRSPVTSRRVDVERHERESRTRASLLRL